MILGIETSTVACSVALFAGRLLAEHTLYIKQAHSVKLMTLVDAVFKDTGAFPADLSTVAVSTGPGSFTGLRIGVSTAKGLAFGWDKPAVPVPTLDALALSAIPWPGHICSLLTARKGEVYGALYDGLTGDPVKQAGCFAVDSLAPLFENTKGSVLILGDAAGMCSAILADVLGPRAVFAPENRRLPRASTVCEMAVRLLDAGRTVSPLELRPAYLRLSEAELKWESRQKKANC